MMETLPALVVLAVASAALLASGRRPSGRSDGQPDIVLRVALVLLVGSVAFTVAMFFFESPRPAP